jgi:hypothetical protein
MGAAALSQRPTDQPSAPGGKLDVAVDSVERLVGAVAELVEAHAHLAHLVARAKGDGHLALN